MIETGFAAPKLQRDSKLQLEDPMVRMMWTEDDGDFSVPASLISDFPNNSELDVTLARGNYTMMISDNGQNNCSLVGLTHAFASMFLAP